MKAAEALALTPLYIEDFKCLLVGVTWGNLGIARDRSGSPTLRVCHKIFSNKSDSVPAIHSHGGLNENAMPISPHPPLTFYPAYCFPVAPTHNTWAKLTAADVHALRERSGFEGQNLYFYLNHPIKWVRLVGVIVAFDVFPTRWIMVLDDSSGSTIEVTCGRSAARVSIEKGVATKDATSLGRVTCAGEDSQIGTTATGRTIDLKGVDVGAVVKVKGGIGTFRGEKQLVLERLCTC